MDGLNDFQDHELLDVKLFVESSESLSNVTELHRVLRELQLPRSKVVPFVSELLVPLVAVCSKLCEPEFTKSGCWQVIRLGYWHMIATWALLRRPFQIVSVVGQEPYVWIRGRAGMSMQTCYKEIVGVFCDSLSQCLRDNEVLPAPMGTDAIEEAPSPQPESATVASSSSYVPTPTDTPGSPTDSSMSAGPPPPPWHTAAESLREH